jgi:hypothetical protein
VNNLDWTALLARLRALSKEMLDFAKADEWDAVITQEAQRCGLIETLFAQPMPPAVIPSVADCIREVLANDKVLLTLARKAREKIIHHMTHLDKGRKACLAYESS